MPNLFRHLTESNSYETLNQVQGDKIVIATHSPLRGEGGVRGCASFLRIKPFAPGMEYSGGGVCLRSDLGVLPEPIDSH